MSLSKFKKKALLEQRNFLKDQINSFTKYFYNEIPPAIPITKVSQITAKVFAELKENLKRQPTHYYKDKNFPRLIEMVERLIILLAETDNHYEKWLMYFYFQIALAINNIMTKNKIHDFEELLKFLLTKEC